MAIAITLHLLAAAIWVGGMFFAYMALRPAAAEVLEPPLRLTLWSNVFQRFFVWVWLAVIALPATGYWLMFSFHGGFAGASWTLHLMQLIAWIMIGLFLHLYFGPYRRLRELVRAQIYPEAAGHLNRIRQIIAINLSLGLIELLLGSGGRFL
jgi:uncharacterized membrane protein